MIKKLPSSLSKLDGKIGCALKIKQKDAMRSQCRLGYSESQSLFVFREKTTYNMSTEKTKSTNFHQSMPKSSPSTFTTAIEIMQSLQSYIQSRQFKKSRSFSKKEFDSYYYLQKYSWLCIHTWILLYRIRQCESLSEVMHSYLLKTKILRLLEDYTRDQVYQYDEIFDRHIYEELKRRQEVIFWALDQYFVFNHKEKDLGQIIQQDFGLWPDLENTQNFNQDNQITKTDPFDGLQKKDQNQGYRWKKQEQMKSIGQYFLSKISSISNLSYDTIKTGKLQDWLRL